MALEAGEDSGRNWYDEIERLKVKLALALFLVVGIFVHFIVVYLTEGGINLFAFFEKTADAIIIAAVIGITYEWYASQSRTDVLRREIEEVVRDEVGEEVEAIKRTLVALADEDTAAFSIIDPSQAEEELREKIEVCNEIKCMGDFRHADDQGLIESLLDGSENSLEHFIYERIKDQDDDFRFFRIYPHKDGDRSWVNDHQSLFEHVDGEDSPSYHLLPHPHQADYPLPSFMVVDDKNTARGDLLILAIPEEEDQFEEFQKQMLLFTEDETVINAFEEYFGDIWDSSRCIESSEELVQIRESGHQ